MNAHATFVVALVFLPVLAMSGVQGKIFAPLGVAYILAILSSLGVPLTSPSATCRPFLARCNGCLPSVEILTAAAFQAV